MGAWGQELGRVGMTLRVLKETRSVPLVQLTLWTVDGSTQAAYSTSEQILGGDIRHQHRQVKDWVQNGASHTL